METKRLKIFSEYLQPNFLSNKETEHLLQTLFLKSLNPCDLMGETLIFQINTAWSSKFHDFKYEWSTKKGLDNVYFSC